MFLYILLEIQASLSYFFPIKHNSQLLFLILIVSHWGGVGGVGGGLLAGIYFTTNLSLKCRLFSVTFENLNAPLFPSPIWAADTDDWCITMLGFHLLSEYIVKKNKVHKTFKLFLKNVL